MNTFTNCYAVDCGTGFRLGEGFQGSFNGGGAIGCDVGMDVHKNTDAKMVGMEIKRNNVGVNVRDGSVSQRKVGRNEKCPCGSGLKYKRCCIDK